MSHYHLKHDEFTLEVMVAIPAGQSDFTFPLPAMEHLRRIYLNEWVVANPGTVTDETATNPTVLFNPQIIRVDFSGAQIDNTIRTNLPAQGYPLLLGGDLVTDKVYDRPRLMADFKRGYFTSVHGILYGVTPQFRGKLTGHGGVTLHMTFVCKNPTWNPDKAVADTINEPRFIDLPFGGRNKNFY